MAKLSVLGPEPAVTLIVPGPPGFKVFLSKVITGSPPLAPPGSTVNRLLPEPPWSVSLPVPISVFEPLPPSSRLKPESPCRMLTPGPPISVL